MSEAKEATKEAPATREVVKPKVADARPAAKPASAPAGPRGRPGCPLCGGSGVVRTSHPVSGPIPKGDDGRRKYETESACECTRPPKEE